MIKSINYLIIAAMLSSCVATGKNPVEEKESTISFVEKFQSNIASLKKYRLFSYKVNTEGPRTLVGFSGQFEWNGNCLDFVSDDFNKKYTPIFPLQTTTINSDGTSFNVSGISFSIGDKVVLGGSFTKASDNKVFLFTEGNPKCLLEETFTII